MAGLNKVEIIGRLGNDPEQRAMPNGDPVCNLSIATSETWKDAQGNKQERTEWHRVTIFGKVAEIAGKYLRKGSQCYISGKLQTREWEKDGVKRYTTEIIVTGFDGKLILLESAKDGGNANQAQQQGQQRPQSQQRQAPQQAPQQDSFDDDIPF